MGTSNREPQEYSRNMMEYKDPSRYIPIILLLHSWGSRFGVPSEVPVHNAVPAAAVAQTRSVLGSRRVALGRGLGSIGSIGFRINPKP